MKRPQFILHGGSVRDVKNQSAAALEFMRDCCARAFQDLRAGAESVAVVEAAVREMEKSGLFLAGKGAHPNQLGAYELDASIMNGCDASSGAVAGVCDARYAIGLAARVRASGKAVMLSGPGARHAFADDPCWLPAQNDYFEPIALKSSAAKTSGLSTVGAAAMDVRGDCAAATATGGVIGKQAGRIGDTAVIGAGTWADFNVAISCTGQGEYFIRAAAARSVAARMRFGGQSAAPALESVIGEIGALGGVGGMIAASPEGVYWSFNSKGLKRAWIDADGAVHASY